MSSKNDFWLAIRDQYLKRHRRKTYVHREVVIWAKREGLWELDDDAETLAGMAQLRSAVKNEIDSETGLPKDINWTNPQGTFWVDWKVATFEQRQHFLNMLTRKGEEIERKATKYCDLFQANRRKGDPDHQLRLMFTES